MGESRLYKFIAECIIFVKAAGTYAYHYDLNVNILLVLLQFVLFIYSNFISVHSCANVNLYLKIYFKVSQILVVSFSTYKV
jgi:hypothetical protein